MKLYDYANCGNFNQKIINLSDMAMPENWGTSNSTKDHPVLHNYIVHYFSKVYDDDLIAYATNHAGKEIACFNTGLLTPHYDDIYAYFEKNESGRQEWFLAAFLNGSSY